MKTTVAPLEGNKVKLSVEVDEDEFDKAITDAFRKIAREVRIPGFRPGKAPRKVLERRLGAQVGREQALHDALPEYYAQAVTDNDVDAIDAPEIDITAGEEDGPVAFDAVVEVRPVVQVAGYGGLRVEIARPEVPEEEVDAQIDRMRQVQATFADVDRAAQAEDAVVIDITGTLDGDAQDGLTADDYSYTVGSKAITPEVDEQLTGAKAGDILEFDATHPDPDEERQLRFKVLVKQVRERVLPEADDAWASENSEFDTIDGLRRSIRDRGALVRKAQAQSALREGTGQALAKLVYDDVPEALVTHEMNHRAQDLALRLQAQGLTPEQWLAITGKSSEDLTAELREAAETSAKVDLALRAVADAEEPRVHRRGPRRRARRGGRARRRAGRPGAGRVRTRRQPVGCTLRCAQAQGTRLAPRAGRDRRRGRSGHRQGRPGGQPRQRLPGAIRGRRGRPDTHETDETDETESDAR